MQFLGRGYLLQPPVKIPVWSDGWSLMRLYLYRTILQCVVKYLKVDNVETGPWKGGRVYSKQQYPTSQVTPTPCSPVKYSGVALTLTKAEGNQPSLPSTAPHHQSLDDISVTSMTSPTQKASSSESKVTWSHSASTNVGPSSSNICRQTAQFFFINL